MPTVAADRWLEPDVSAEAPGTEAFVTEKFVSEPTRTGTARTRENGAEPTGSSEPDVLVEAEDLEIVLPSGDGVGPLTGTIRAGEQVLLLGPSGSGKSTLLRALAGALPSHQRARVTGSVRVGGIDPVAGGVIAASTVVGHLGQDPADGVCLPQVADDVALPLENRRTPARRIGDLVHGTLRRVGAGDLADRQASTLSGGQLQRAALAAVLAARPRLLLLDEPTAMLDADGIAAVRSSVRSATDDGEVATVLVEHRLDEWTGAQGVAALPPRTIALDRSGRVLADGPTAAVLERHGAALRDAGCWLPRDVEETLEAAGAHATPSRTGTTTGRALAPDLDLDLDPEPPRPGSPATGPVPGEPLLTARGATLGQAARAVLENIDLEARAGELLAVVGRNGGGKSTLLGALARLDAPMSGTVVGAAAGLVFQRPEAQFVAGTVAGELSASGASEGAVSAMLDRLALTDWATASPFQLSGGQQRRLSIGAMLLAERPVLLVDEPGFGLDRAAQKTVLGLLREAAAEGRAVVMTTHDLRAVEQADAVAVIAEGRLHGPMPPDRLLTDTDLLRRAGLVVGLEARAPSVTRDPAEPSPPERVEPTGPAEAAEAEGPDSSGPRPWLSRRNPTVLLGLLTVLSIVCIALTDPVPLAVLYLLLMVGTAVGCRIRPLPLLRAQVPFMVFASGVFLVNVLSRPGHEPWPDLPIRITREGIVLGAALALRALVIGLGALTVARATDPRRTMVSLQQHARVPPRYAYALLAGRRLLDDLPTRWEAITRAHRVRLPLTTNGTVGRLRPRHLVGCAFALLVDAIRSAERLAFALESRGLGAGPRTIWRPVACGRADALLVAVVTMSVGTILLLS